MAFGYAQLEQQLVTVLQADPRLAGVDISPEPDPPTSEQCPAIRVGVVGFVRRSLAMVGGLNHGGAYWETMTIGFSCWEFRGEGGADARAAVFGLVQTLEAVLADQPTLGGTVQIGQILQGNFAPHEAGAGGIFWVATLSAEAQAFV